MRQGSEEAKEEREGKGEIPLGGPSPVGRRWGGSSLGGCGQGWRSDYLELMVTNDLTSVARGIVNSLAPQTATNDRLLVVITLTLTASPAPQVSLVLFELFLLIPGGGRRGEAKEVNVR